MSRSWFRLSALHRGWIAAFALVASGGLFGGLWSVQSSPVDGDSRPASSTAVGWRVLPPVRGKILDRNGTPLAENRAAFNLYVLPRRFTAGVRARLIDLLALSDEEVAEMDGRVGHVGADSLDRATLVLEDQGSRRAGLVAQERRELGGAVEIHEESHRVYPYGEVAAHLIGYLDQPASRQVPEPAARGFGASAPVGRSGVEEALESRLRGAPGIERFLLDANGERVEGVDASGGLEGPQPEPPVDGDDVVLTVDLELQRLAEEAVSRHAAAGVAIVDVETGRILALVSTPSFDPNAMTGRLASAQREWLASDPRQPSVDRTLERHYPPGSTYKLVTAIAGLVSGAVKLDEEVTCTGRRVVGDRILYDMRAHGAVALLEALQVSCNVYFWKVGERVGIDRMTEVARDFGFGEPTGLGINRETSGQVPDSAAYRPNAGPDLVQTLKTAIGVGDARITVIQLAMAYAALANGGRLYASQVVRRVRTSSGDVVEEREPVLRRAVAVSQANLEIVRRGMWRAVNAPGGTAFSARRGATRLAGKTGTAPVGPGRAPDAPAQPLWYTALSHAWFAGWAPADRPRIAIAVLIEHGGIGGAAAAPVARAIVDGYFRRVLPRERPAEKQPPPR